MSKLLRLIDQDTQHKADPFSDGKKVIRAGLIVIAVMFGGFGTWIALAPLSGAVIAPGSVKIEANRKTIQHLEGGIVKAILVREGEYVAKGQRLILLNDLQASASVSILSDQLDAETARDARLAAERNYASEVVYPPALQQRAKADSKVAELLQNDLNLFQAKRKSLDGQMELLRSQTKQIKDQILGLAQQIESAQQSIGYLREELTANETLYKKNYVQYTRLLALKRAISEKEENQGEYIARKASAQQQISEMELRIISLRDAYTQGATDEQKDVTKKIFDLQDRLRPTSDALERLTVTAPVAGQVVGLQVHTTGGVVSPGEPLLDIVPSNNQLIIEARVQTTDIDDVHKGMEAEVRLSAYKQRTTPLVKGTVTYVSGDSFTDKTQNSAPPYYLVHINVDPKSLKDIGQEITLYPGMPVEVFIKTVSRTALQYIFDPVTSSLNRAFREP